jgi:hypothetical protein
MRVTSSLRISYEGEWDAMGVGLADVLTLPDAQAELVGWMTRQGEVSLADVAVYMGQAEPDARTMLNGLVERGVVGAIQRADETQYETRIATRRGRQLPQEIWQALAEDGNASPPADELPPPSSFGQRLHRMTRSEHSRFLLGISPIIAAFLSAEWLLLTGAGSFAGLLSFLGVIVVSLLAGIFPVLLLLSSRRKGEHVPAVVYRLIGHPVLLIGTYLLSLASVFLHGLVIWEHPILRAGAVFVGIVMIMMTIIVARRGAFSPRVTIELRHDQRETDQALFTITANGQAAVTNVQLRYPQGEQHKQLATGQLPAFGSLRQATFGPYSDGQLRARFAELKVWGHMITPVGDSEGLPALVEVHHGAKTEQFDLQVSGGHVVLPLSDPVWRVDIMPKERSEPGATE